MTRSLFICLEMITPTPDVSTLSPVSWDRPWRHPVLVERKSVETI